MTWSDFSTGCTTEFAPVIEMQQLAREFQDLHQTTETMAEITTKFQERALLVPQYAADKEMKKVRYHDMLQDDMRKFVSISGSETLNYMTSRARGREIDLEHFKKRMSDQVHILEGLKKSPKTSDQLMRGQ